MHDTRSDPSGQLAPGMPPESTTMFPPVHKCDSDRSEAAGCASTRVADYFVLCTDEHIRYGLCRTTGAGSTKVIVCERAQVCNTNEYIWIYMCMYAGVCLVNHMQHVAW